MQMDAGLDTGPMLLREAVPITGTTTAAGLHDALAEIGAQLILRALAEDSPPVPQPAHDDHRAPKLTRDAGRSTGRTMRRNPRGRCAFDPAR